MLANKTNDPSRGRSISPRSNYRGSQLNISLSPEDNGPRSLSNRNLDFRATLINTRGSDNDLIASSKVSNVVRARSSLRRRDKK